MPSAFAVGDLVQCTHCGKIEPATRSSDELLAEIRARFPDIPKTEMALLCDNCEKEYNAWRTKIGPDERAKLDAEMRERWK